MPGSALLQALGDRVRSLREARGDTLAELAEAAALSRRFLVEIESGRANPSLRKLAALAGALGRPLAELCDLPLGPPPQRYALIGLRGAGKSTLGRLFAAHLEVPFGELDDHIEALRGLTRGEIFALEGAASYRRSEADALEDWLAHHGTGVLAVPGGIVESLPTYQRLLATCRTIWLQAAPEEHWQRVAAQGDTRPMRADPAAMERLRQLLEERSAAYAKAMVHVDTSGRSPGDCLETILDTIFHGA